jgi:hypothetical protein
LEGLIVAITGGLLGQIELVKDCREAEDRLMEPLLCADPVKLDEE